MIPCLFKDFIVEVQKGRLTRQNHWLGKTSEGSSISAGH